MPASEAQTTFAGHYAAKAVPTVTAEPIASDAKVVTTGVVITAPKTNTVPVYIGGSGVTTTDGTPIEPGFSLTLNVRDPSMVYCITTIAAQALRVLAV